MTPVLRRRGVADDGGVTLIELIMYVGLAAVVLGLMTALFTTGWQSQAATTESDSLTGRAAVTNETLQSGIRSASWFAVTDDGGTLRARVLIDSGSSECRAWVVTGEGDLLYRTSPAPIDVAPAREASAGEAPAGWVSLVHRESTDGLPVRVTGAFEADARELRYHVTLSSQGSSVPLVGGATSAGGVGGAPC
ncbi:hypothetical protein GCM10025760_30890 [Microbacterium yannicii]|uniref:Type II secretion system protein n=1 Tax=Microbacterium yannicii TaxID=671622 RepID=A0ABP9MIE3_9MICO|nr:hypothetical protein [Microbacterium yannicii]MCO5951568.1 hypothetical protein [Microbacterium yannicii]